MIRIIGIDPGLASTGFGIVRGSGSRVDSHAFGSIRTSAATSLPGRLHHIFSSLHSVLTQEKHDLMVVEDVFSLQRYPKSGISLGQVTGVVLLAAYQAGVPHVAIPVREAKKVLTGNGGASKIQLEKSVRHFLHLSKPITPHHASDAVALALIGLLRYARGETGLRAG